MCEALRELFKDELEEGITKARFEVINQGIKSMIEACKSLVGSRDVVLNMVMEKFDLSEDEAENYMELYW